MKYLLPFALLLLLSTFPSVDGQYKQPEYKIAKSIITKVSEKHLQT